MADPLMEENFFIENPEMLENKFYRTDKEFDKNFKEKSQQIVDTMSKKNRHFKKVQKQAKKAKKL